MSDGDLSNFFGGGFDSNSIEPQCDFDILPPGKYPVIIEKAEVKKTSKKDGHYIFIMFCVLDGTFKGKKLFDNINIQNPSQECTEIGLRVLAALGQAIGVTAIRDTAQLVGQTCIAHVKVKNEKNEIRTYSQNIQSQQQSNSPSQYPPGPADYQSKSNDPQQKSKSSNIPPAPTGGQPPWLRK